MSTSFCFHCQKDIQPKQILWWKFCPHCHRKITNKDSGLYLICDNCGANNPVDAEHCIKCGNGLNGYEETNIVQYFITHSWLIPIVNFAVIFLGIMLTIGILYISFSLFLVLFVFGIIWYIVNLLFNLWKH